jgi:membrane protein implicated in regulation of membrane protease activity
VLSFYFWVYLIVSVSLTAVTVFGWWRYTRTSHRRRRPKERRISYTGGTKYKVGKKIFFRPEFEGGKEAV